jgi:hypothetical protein
LQGHPFEAMSGSPGLIENTGFNYLAIGTIPFFLMIFAPSSE